MGIRKLTTLYVCIIHLISTFKWCIQFGSIHSWGLQDSHDQDHSRSSFCNWPKRSKSASSCAGNKRRQHSSERSPQRRNQNRSAQNGPVRVVGDSLPRYRAAEGSLPVLSGLYAEYKAVITPRGGSLDARSATCTTRPRNTNQKLQTPSAVSNPPLSEGERNLSSPHW